jgi:hypothetical protein
MPSGIRYLATILVFNFTEENRRYEINVGIAGSVAPIDWSVWEFLKQQAPVQTR